MISLLFANKTMCSPELFDLVDVRDTLALQNMQHRRRALIERLRMTCQHLIIKHCKLFSLSYIMQMQLTIGPMDATACQL